MGLSCFAMLNFCGRSANREVLRFPPRFAQDDNSNFGERDFDWVKGAAEISSDIDTSHLGMYGRSGQAHLSPVVELQAALGGALTDGGAAERGRAMSDFDLKAPFSRRRALAMGASVVGGFVAASSLQGGRVLAMSSDGDGGDSEPPAEIIQDIEEIIQAQGQVSNGVFQIEIDRNDIPNVTLHGVPIKPSFEINGTLNFQAVNGSTSVAMMNSDMALKAEELDPFIHQLILHNITFQAEHQHFYDFSPMVWFVHFRAMGDPIQIAKGIKAALNVTSTPFPQTMPSNPTTPLPADGLGRIIGATPSIGSDGVVNFQVPRAETIRLGGIVINPYLNVATTIGFEPLGGGDNAAAVPDFGMLASEVNPVVGLMQQQGWDIGCLYNQETDEYPQLYFSHNFKTGNAVELARQIRRGLDLMNVRLM